MNRQDIVEKLNKWMIEFVEVPNLKLGNWPPCPFARQARMTNSIEILFAEYAELHKVIQDSINLLNLKEVVIICFDHTNVDATALQTFVTDYNKFLMMDNVVILEDHPDAVEYINGVKMNFGECGLILVQKLDKLNKASDQLKEKGYYNHWTEQDLDSVVNWRYK
jgi:hypothetical protein